MKLLTVGHCARKIIETAAIEIFPHECFGFILGDCNHVVYAYPFQKVKRFSNEAAAGVTIDTETVNAVLEHLGEEEVMGDFHSHPNQSAYLSRIRETDDSDEWDLLHSDDSLDGKISLIVSVYPAKTSKSFNFRWLAYTVESGKIHKLKVKFI